MPALQSRKQQSYPAEVRARLEVVAVRFGQREIARRTGNPVSNVSRWLSGTRVPAEFLAALVREFHVNPAWLLSGEGTPWLADVSAGTQRMAGDLLELVDALASVSRMRLGALAGKRDLKVLRELDDALRRHETLRENLDQRSVPIFTQLIKDWRSSNDALDRAKSEALRKATRQVARLCGNDDLHREWNSVEAYHEFLWGTSPKVLEFQRRAFLMSLGARGLVEEPFLHEARRLCLNLHNDGRFDESLRTLESVLTLCRHKSDWPAYASLEALHGWMLGQSGRPRQALVILPPLVPRLGGMIRNGVLGAIQTALAMSGLVSFATALREGPGNDEHAGQMLELAVAVGTPAELELCLHARRASMAALPPSENYYEIRASLLLRAQRERGPAPAAEFRRVVDLHDHDPPSFIFNYNLALCQVELAAGRFKQAMACHQQAEAALAKYEPEHEPGCLTLCTHHANSLELATAAKPAQAKQWKDSAETFFEHCAQAGAMRLRPRAGEWSGQPATGS